MTARERAIEVAARVVYEHAREHGMRSWLNGEFAAECDAIGAALDLPPSDAGERDRALVKETIRDVLDASRHSLVSVSDVEESDIRRILAAVNATHPPDADECRVSRSHRCGFVQTWRECFEDRGRELDRLTAIIGDVIDVCEPDPADEDEPRDVLAVAKRCAAALAQMTTERDEWKVELARVLREHAEGPGLVGWCRANVGAGRDICGACADCYAKVKAERDEWKKRAEEADQKQHDALALGTRDFEQASQLVKERTAERDEARRERDAATAALDKLRDAGIALAAANLGRPDAENCACVGCDFVKALEESEDVASRVRNPDGSRLLGGSANVPEAADPALSDLDRLCDALMATPDGSPEEETAHIALNEYASRLALDEHEISRACDAATSRRTAKETAR